MFQRIIRYGFYLLFILVPLVFLPNTSELFEFNKIIITYILTIIIVAAWLARMIANKKWLFRRTALDIPLIIFLVINLVSLLFSIDMHTSWFGYYSRWNGGLLSLISYALLYWAFVSNMTSKHVLRTLHLALSTAAIVAAWGVAEHFGADAHIWVQDVQTRVFSTLGQPNWLAAYLVALIFVPISYLSSTPSPKLGEEQRSGVRYGLLALSILLFITLLFTRSRSGLLAFGISSVVYWGIVIIKNKFQISNFKFQIAGFILLTLTLTLAFPNPVRDIVFGSRSLLPKATDGTSLEVGGTESGNIRKIVWTGAIRIWQASTKNQLIGTGPETFAMSYYQYRPIEHNQTSEWELLYNKAHNEFLNYLATTGLLGLSAYLILLGTIIWIFKRNLALSTLHLALFCGWLTISVTNFLGFSVVIVQILLFLLPAMTLVLSAKDEVLRSEEETPWMFLLFLFLITLPIIFVARYWLADTKLAASQKQTKYFQATQTPQYLLAAYQDATNAYQLNNREPVIASELSNAAAYLSLAIANQSTASAQQLAQISLVTSNQAIQTSPNHPNYYKSRARSLILLSDQDPQYLQLAADTLEKAMAISPTDPRLPYNLGVVYKFLNQFDKAKVMFAKALELKPDFADPKKQLEEINSLKP